jgi:hypothetical protein
MARGGFELGVLREVERGGLQAYRCVRGGRMQEWQPLLV